MTVITTLTNPKAFPKRLFRDLYRRRWSAELFLRDIKTTMGMEQLSCRTPSMVHKELAMYFIAYNLVRTLMFEGARQARIKPTQISFKQSVDLAVIWSATLAELTDGEQRERVARCLLHYVGQAKVPSRPNRSEPRAVKRRPKNYERLNKPRHEFEETPHRNRYHKAPQP